jgi:hypothetical protein
MTANLTKFAQKLELKIAFLEKLFLEGDVAERLKAAVC